MEQTSQQWSLDQLERDGMAWPPASWEYPAGSVGQADGVGAAAAPEADIVPQPSSWSRIGGIAREIAETLVLTIAIFLLIKIPFQNFRIEGSSMEPNFHTGQYLIVNKALYWPWFSKPARGDVVVLVPPRSPDRDFIKRVIGLPGETVEIRQGKVLINGKPLDEEYLPHSGSYSSPATTLGPEEYYVLGDNRDNSNDSHSWGPLPKENIVGKAWVSYWPPQEWGVVPDAKPALAQ